MADFIETMEGRLSNLLNTLYYQPFYLLKEYPHLTNIFSVNSIKCLYNKYLTNSTLDRKLKK